MMHHCWWNLYMCLLTAYIPNSNCSPSLKILKVISTIFTIPLMLFQSWLHCNLTHPGLHSHTHFSIFHEYKFLSYPFLSGLSGPFVPASVGTLSWYIVPRKCSHTSFASDALHSDQGSVRESMLHPN